VTDATSLVDQILDISEGVRAAAVYRGGEWVSRVRPGVPAPWSGQTDRYEEMLVNPALLTLTHQRGVLDRGGVRYLIVRYEKFFRLLVPLEGGHVSVCLDLRSQPTMLAGPILQLVEKLS